MSRRTRFALQQARNELHCARAVRHNPMLHSLHISAAQGWIAMARRLA